METGILYVVFNEWIRSPETNKMPYKIGITKGSVYDRYYGLGLKMPGKFIADFAYKFDDCTRVEQLIHGILKNYRENGEWFNIGREELELIKKNCETMGGLLVTDEVINEIENETEENLAEIQNTITSEVGSPSVPLSGKAINPSRPCKVFLFPIRNAISDRRDIYEATRMYWRITEEYRDVSKYEYAVGLDKGVSVGAFKINKWDCQPNNGKCKFDGDEVNDLKGFSWNKQISVNKGYWQLGNHFVVEFDGKGKFRLIRPSNDQWLDC